ncbi:PPOX class F420-dependent oxidoreductase [Streptomyces sp. NPDC001948]
MAVPDDIIPADYRDLLERPLFAHLATVRPDGTPQINAMWFDWDGAYLYFTSTIARYKHRNVTARPSVAVSVSDPDDPYRHLEVRGRVERIEPDTEGIVWLRLAARYGDSVEGPPADAAQRVVYVVRPVGTSSFTRRRVNEDASRRSLTGGFPAVAEGGCPRGR